MANVTVCSTSNYTIKFDSDGGGGSDAFNLNYGSAAQGILTFITGGQAGDFPNSPPTFTSTGLVHLESSSSSGNIAEWKLFNGTAKASLSNSGALTLTNASLRLPILGTLPSSPVEGMLIIKQDGSSNEELTAYLGGGWRYSGVL